MCFFFLQKVLKGVITLQFLIVWEERDDLALIQSRFMPSCKTETAMITQKGILIEIGNKETVCCCFSMVSLSIFGTIEHVNLACF